MAKKYWIIAGLLLWTLGLGTVLHGTPVENSKWAIDESYERGPFEVRLMVDKTDVSLSDTVVMRVELTADEQYDVTPVDVNELLVEGFEVIEAKGQHKKMVGEAKVMAAYQYRLEPYGLGQQKIPQIDFEFYKIADPNEQKQIITSKEIVIQVAASVSDDPNQQKTIAEIEGVIAVKRAIWPIVISVAAGLLLLAAVIAVARKIKKHKIQTEIRTYKTAKQIAFEKMDELLKINTEIGNKQKVKLFYQKLGDIVRYYIEDEFEIASPKKTTQEFMTEVNNVKIFVDYQSEKLGQFLSYCDLVKFAKYQPNSSQIKISVNLAKVFIESTASEKLVDVTNENDGSGKGQ